MAKSKLIYGIRACIEAINSGQSIEKILFKKGLNGSLFSELRSLVTKNKIPFQYVPIEKINRITQGNHQGVIAYTSLIEYQPLEEIIPGIYEAGELPFILVLDHITDVRNFGAICRSAEAAGIHAVIIPDKGSAQINPDAIKTSAGALNNLPVCRVKSLHNSLKYLQDAGLKLTGASEKAEKVYFEADFNTPIAIVMGSEDEGISPNNLNILDELVKIPISGQVESLNVSVATAIIVFEAVKQRGNA